MYVGKTCQFIYAHGRTWRFLILNYVIKTFKPYHVLSQTSLKENHPFSYDNFEILDCFLFDLHPIILENLWIQKLERNFEWIPFLHWYWNSKIVSPIKFSFFSIYVFVLVTLRRSASSMKPRGTRLINFLWIFTIIIIIVFVIYLLLLFLRNIFG